MTDRSRQEMPSIAFTQTNPGPSAHRRERFGIASLGGYVLVGTGKYSVAAWLKAEVAAKITGRS